MNLKRFEAVRLEAEETAVHKFRKHWFVLLRDSIATALAALFPAVVLLLASWAGFTEMANLSASFWSLVNFWWLLVVWLALSAIWTNYYLDLWLITDKRLISVDQTGLFQRKVTTLSFSNIQDVTVEQHGIIQTLLNFGTVKVHGAGPTGENMTIRGVAQPAVIRDELIKHCEKSRMRAPANTSNV